LIQDFVPVLALCSVVIAGLLGAGWKLSEKQDYIRATYERRVGKFRTMMDSAFREHLVSLYGVLEGARGEKEKISENDLTGPEYRDLVSGAYSMLSDSNGAQYNYHMMWTSCSHGGRQLMGAGILLVSYPFLFFFFSDGLFVDFVFGFVTIGVVVSMLAAYGSRNVLVLMRHRDRLFKVFGKHPEFQASD
jgi:hypothetical protein